MRTFLIWGYLFTLAAAGGAVATNDAGASKIFPFKYEMKDLPNGLRVIVIPTDYPNIVALQIPVQTGSRNEVEAGKSGFAHFFEHMMFRGTEQYSAAAYNEVLKNAGADQNAYTSDDLTNYHITFSKDDLEKVLELEADRFQNLKYPEADFKTEAKAVLGEYNKNSANPFNKIIEVQRKAAFNKHTYRHTTMGFIEDIEAMPEQYDYSLKFFERYYRPEKVVVILAGDVQADNAFALVEKYWGDWQRGDYEVAIPVEPASKGPVYEHVEWKTPTLPWVTVAFHGPAFSETENDMATMDIIQSLAFSKSSPLYQKLVVKEQKVDRIFPYFPDRKDPYLLTVAARVKNPDDIWYVRDEMLQTFADLRTDPVSRKRVADIKSNLKYSFANGMDNSEAIASAIVEYVAKTRDPETVNRVNQLYDTITPQHVQQKAGEYFTDNGLVVVTLSQQALPQMANLSGSVDEIVKMEAESSPEIATVLQRGQSPIVNFRILFRVGAAADPAGKAGLAQLTASMISSAGSKSMKYAEIQKALYPLAGSFGNQVDKEMTVFTGTTHRDNLSAFYEIAAGHLLNPAWDESDFKRVKANLINSIKVDLRENNDEELGKEMLYEAIYSGHPYGTLNSGHVEDLEQLTLAEVQEFYRQNYTQANLVLGMAGNFGDDFLSRAKKDLGALPGGSSVSRELPKPVEISGLQAEIIQKDTRATAVSFGFPIEVTRSHEDFAALWLARSYLGEHRSTNSHLFQRIREIRGMNYGDYAYIEYFPRGMFQFHPDPNLGRSQQIFQVWIRPVESAENGHFATRVAMFELSKLIKDGVSQEDFEATRNYLLKFSNILTRTQDRQLGYAQDSHYYGLGEFTSTMAERLKKLTVEDVNQAIRKHLQDKNVKFVFITKDADDLKSRLVNNTKSVLTYQSEKPAELLAEDKIIQDYKLDFKAENVKIVPVNEVFVK